MFFHFCIFKFILG